MLEEGAVSTMALEVTHRQEGKASKASKGSTKGTTKAHIDRLICTAANPTAHFSVVVDGLRLSAVRFVSGAAFLVPLLLLLLLLLRAECCALCLRCCVSVQGLCS